VERTMQQIDFEKDYATDQILVRLCNRLNFLPTRAERALAFPLAHTRHILAILASFKTGGEYGPLCAAGRKKDRHQPKKKLDFYNREGYA